MILDDAQLLKILQQNPAGQTLAVARKRSALLYMHITGEGLQDAITQMEYFEDDQKKNLRQKYARSNKDFMSRLHRPIDKIFSAKGGSLILKMPEKLKEKFQAYLSNIRSGLSLTKWVQMVAQKAYLIDPNGLIFVEADGNGTPYPTYKSTQDIYDYQTSGRKLEYVIFKLTPTEVKKYIGEAEASGSLTITGSYKMQDNSRYYRVVDDMLDRIIEWQGGENSFIEVPGLTLPNMAMQVPALIVSDIISFNSNLYASPDDEVVELANDFLTDCSSFSIWKKLQMFPKHWRYRSVCSTCMGNRLKDGVDCADCDGTGFKKKVSVRDELVIPLPEADQKFPDKFSGYDTPDIDGWQLMTDEMERLYDLAYQTLWGCVPRKDAKNNGTEKTATEVLYSQTDKVERLQDFSQWAQSIERFVIDTCGQMMFQTAYGGCSRNYGDRYVLESPDVLWDKYNKARKDGAPQATLDGLLRDYYESRYEGSPMDLQKALKLMKVEPWTHLTIQQIETITTTEADKASKIYFSEWVSTMNDMDIIMTDEKVLRAQLLVFAEAKAEIINAEELASIQAQAQADALNAPVQRTTQERTTS